MSLLQQLSSNPLAFVIFLVILIASLTFHEAAHALVAKWLGDDTAEQFGRLTLNPLAHLDPLGFVAILIAGVGWAKPVPVNPNNFENPRVGNLIVALAGPLSNLLLAIIFAIFNAVFHPDGASLAGTFTQAVIQFNLALMFFNLIPIPPLDGSKIIHLFMSDEVFFQFERIGFYLLIGLIALSWFGFPILSNLIFGPANWLYSILLRI